jgi:hypothetical protein
MKCTRSNADGPICRKKQVLLYLCSLLLTLSYALEPNPGPRPIKFPCAVCNKTVKWSTPGVCCDWAGNENEEVWLFLSVVTVIRVLYSSLTRTTLHNKIVHVKVSVNYNGFHSRFFFLCLTLGWAIIFFECIHVVHWQGLKFWYEVL